MAAENGQRLDDRPLPELMKTLADQTATLVRQEIDLAKAEFSEKGKKAGQGAGMFGGAGVIGFLALAALTAAAILGLATALPDWLAALIVGLVYAGVAGVLALQGRNKVQEAGPPIPEQTVDTVKEDVEWAKTQKKSVSR
jgi:Putative Actinobacterial Holin-X, holin superfamily III